MRLEAQENFSDFFLEEGPGSKPEYNRAGSGSYARAGKSGNFDLEQKSPTSFYYSEEPCLPSLGRGIGRPGEVPGAARERSHGCRVETILTRGVAAGSRRACKPSAAVRLAKVREKVACGRS